MFCAAWSFLVAAGQPRWFTIKINHVDASLMQIFRNAEFRLQRFGHVTRVRTKAVYGDDLELEVSCERDEDRAWHLKTLWHAFPQLTKMSFELGLTE